MGELPAAREAVMELSELRPDDFPTMHKRLVIERRLGSPAAIREAAAILAKNAPPDSSPKRKPL